MTPFIDLMGASGAVYRFRKVEGQLPPTGGNFVYVREDEAGPQVLGCGIARTLAGALVKRPTFEAQGDIADVNLYIRLNVSSGKRESEHADLIAQLPQPLAVIDCD